MNTNRPSDRTTSEATEAMQNTFSTAIKGIRDYNAKIAEFAAANTRSQMEFVQRLGAVKSPMEFAQIFQSHSSQQLKTLTEQANELAALAQEIAGSVSEPLKKGFD